MPDDIDRAQERDLQYQADMEIDRKYRAAQEARANAATGECLYCGDPLGGGRRFCDAECRDAWQHEQDLKLMRGVR